MDASALDPRLRAQDAASSASSSSYPPPSTSTGRTQPAPTPTDKSAPHPAPVRDPTAPSTAASTATGRYGNGPTTSTSTAYQAPSQSHSTYPFPPTRHSTDSPHDGHGEADDGHHDSSGLNPDGTDPKKPRACESCRSLKVRCDPDPSNPDGPCKRCAKAGRNCITTQPTRKRQKKTDSRVAELEKKIDALTASLQATRGPPHMPHREDGPPPVPEYGSLKVGLASGWTSSDNDSPSLMRHARQQRHTSSPFGSMDDRGPTYPSPTSSGIAVAPQPPTPQRPSQQLPPMVMAGQKRKHAESTPEDSPAPDRGRTLSQPTPAGTAVAGREYTDIVDRGLINMVKATELFQRYTDHMAPHLPGVIFPEGTTAADVRRSKPILFNAIIAGASSESPILQRTLVRELMQTFADRVIFVGQKSLELVQALAIAVIWYCPPENFEELKFYQLVHIAAVMAIDLGLGRKVTPRRRIPYSWRDHPAQKSALPDPCSPECRRTWLTCYFLASNTAMALHRPNLIRWTPFMQQCVEYLTTSPDASPSDKYLCHLVWTHRMAEEVGVQFSLDDSSSGLINMNDRRTQFALKGFERDLEKYEASVPADEIKPSLKLSFHVLSLYMHEIALQPDGSSNTCEGIERPSFIDSGEKSDAGPPPSPPPSYNNLTAAHINALSACLTAIHGIFETFLGMSIAEIRCLPVFNYVRTAYATVVFIKMYLAVSAPGSELGRVIDRDNMKVEQHLEALLAKFRETAADDRSRPAAKFMLVLALIRSWFLKQGKADGAAAAGAAQGENAPAETSPSAGDASRASRLGSTDTQTNTPSQITKGGTPYSTTANTPLQLLSEIATNDGAANSNAATSTNGYGAASRAPGKTHPAFPWMGGQPQQPQPLFYNENSTPQSQAPANAAAASMDLGTMPWLTGAGGALDFDYATMGDGLSQAMDMTFAGFGAGGAGMTGMGMDAGGWGSNLMMSGEGWLDQLQFQF